MRDVAIKQICDALKKQGVDISSFHALDFFAREADWQTQYYALKVKKIYAWEIEKRFEENLKKNLPPTAQINIGDSFKLARECSKKFDMIVLDNPQGLFGSEGQYCEHFEALPAIISLLKDKCVLILNVKSKPFDYKRQKKWQEKRGNFYGKEDCSNLRPSFIKSYYKKILFSFGFTTQCCFLTLRPQESGLYALTMILKKNEFN